MALRAKVDAVATRKPAKVWTRRTSWTVRWAPIDHARVVRQAAGALEQRPGGRSFISKADEPAATLNVLAGFIGAPYGNRTPVFTVKG